MKSSFNVLSDNEIESICGAVRRILNKKGLRFVAPEVLAVFRKNGFRITEKNVVHITPDELQAALRPAPRKFIRKGAHAGRDVVIGDRETKFAVGSLPIWVIETEPTVSRRPATWDDLMRFTLLSESLDGYSIGNAVVQPREIPNEVMHVLWNRNNAVRMTKPACCWYGDSLERSEEGLEVLRLAAGGLDEVRGLKRWAITVCPDRALEWGASAIGGMVMADAEVPVDILPMPFLGSMYPVTLAGALVQSAVEVLGIVVLTQLVRPGCPVLYAASYGGIMDMKMAAHSFGAPESALFAAASTQIGHAFGLPVNMMQGTSDSKLPDAQAAYEKTMAYLMCALAGADCVTQSGALLDFALSASYESLVIEDEIVRFVKHISRGTLVSKETLAEEEIMNLPFGGHYLESEHTFAHFRDELAPALISDRQSWDKWYSAGAKDAVKRAAERKDAILSGTKPCLGVSEDARRDVDEFVRQICRKYGFIADHCLY